MNIKEQLQRKIDLKTKPLKALGLLEKIAYKIGNVQNTLTPKLTNPTIVVFAADHGLAKEGVSAYPSEVTYQMVLNFLSEGAAINVFCKQNNIDLKIVDAGVNKSFTPHPNLIEAKAGFGTNNMISGNAMTKQELDFCFESGAKIVKDIAVKGTNIIGFGEMGIGNTSSASLLMSSILELPIDRCVGRGTGLDDNGLQRKKTILASILETHPKPKDAKEALLEFGGFEIAQICAAMLEAYKQGMVILVDGFIASSAFLCASNLESNIIDNAIFCHKSDEIGHQLLLRSFEEQAILNMNLRLGEGTGCALAYPLIQNAIAFLNEMASFESANVSNK
ncbi:nicotinate-nucleotide--dimethylbenzimidazole phosphoribosyltransferase [Myroides sp. M-43]|uniref:nicotinate-nucleotide--dimethylbenzimidazole phosphoribosyltransferase n=1 Tax=Myroides oncorhynchi TaxID=2893756 RepID=UPI001E4930F7|nr:nicotinate-nucleotide--dimethylbenzimidazole phosphoribosyltransferase [Myroides oncorhynchi]MCC9042982.1 nicotinate-nucleotide--dimethylbenzimidazole phosphoribosyltransferase [Myroides oncorhynchi]